MEIDTHRRAFLGLRTASPPRALIDDRCLNAQGIICDACKDVCDVRAIVRIRTDQRIAQLTVDTNLCTGCGECAGVCPASAITVSNTTGAA